MEYFFPIKSKLAHLCIFIQKENDIMALFCTQMKCFTIVRDKGTLILSEFNSHYQQNASAISHVLIISWSTENMILA